MASQVRITHHSLPSSREHIVNYSGFNSRERNIPDTFSPSNSKLRSRYHPQGNEMAGC